MFQQFTFITLFFLLILSTKLHNIQSKNIRNLEEKQISIDDVFNLAATERKLALELIEDTLSYPSNELSKSAKELQTILKTLPYIPTDYCAYAYSHGRGEALSLLFQYNVVFDL